MGAAGCQQNRLTTTCYTGNTSSTDGLTSYPSARELESSAISLESDLIGSGVNNNSIASTSLTQVIAKDSTSSTESDVTVQDNSTKSWDRSVGDVLDSVDCTARN